MEFTDTRSAKIEKNFNTAVAEFADKNLAGWMLDLLANDGPAALRGPLVDKRMCDVAIQPFPRLMALAALS